jgi:hypothetical protein
MKQTTPYHQRKPSDGSQKVSRRAKQAIHDKSADRNAEMVLSSIEPKIQKQ